MVWQALKKSVHRVESMAGERSGDLPHVMRFVKILYMREKIKKKSKLNGAESTTLLLAAESMFKIRSNMLYFEPCVILTMYPSYRC